MPDLSITSWRGGMNHTDPAIAIPEDQCTLAQNVEWFDAMLGERRNGMSAVTLPAFLSGRDRLTFAYRHLPTDDDTASELWLLGMTGTASVALGRKTATWQAEVTIPDTPNVAGFAPYRWAGATLHGKLFLAYDSSVDRLHVWDGTSVRRTGLAEPAAPTAANTGSGSLSGPRYYRVRYTVRAGGATLRRSEPSDSATFTPSGSGSAVRVTKPASISEGETHWELEASLDNANFYRIATTAVGTTTYDDSTAYTTGYTSFTLSEDVGDYALLPSAKYLTVDEDRLLYAGAWEDAALASRVGWTPVYGADGVGNDERSETDTDPFLDLDTYAGGPITGLSAPALGAIWVFKANAIFKLVRTGKRQAAYTAIKFSNALGAVPGSVVTAVDHAGSPAVYFLDPEVGPCRIGVGGIKRCGDDLRKTWETLNVDATQVVCTGLYYPYKKQLQWALAVNAGNTPTTMIVLHTALSREFADGVRKGWAVWTGTRATALTACLYADNLEANTARSLTLVPLIGTEGHGLAHLCDTGTTDSGTAFTATLTSRPFLVRSLLQRFQVRAATLCATAVPHATVTVSCVRDFGAETTATVSDISLAATGTETDVLKPLDNLTGAELTVAQFTIADGSSALARWQVNRLDVQDQTEQTA